MLITLIFLQIIALLSLYAIESNQLTSRLTTQYWQKYQLLNTAKQILQSVNSQTQITTPTCTIPMQSTSSLIKQSTQWWKTVSCAGNFQSFQYYYAIEPLGIKTCARIEKQAVDLFRMDLLVIAKSAKQKILLQSIIAKSGSTEATCITGESDPVSPGQQAWRELI
jgi:Tfp pilus assembly protein PilX